MPQSQQAVQAERGMLGQQHRVCLVGKQDLRLFNPPEVSDEMARKYADCGYLASPQFKREKVIMNAEDDDVDFEGDSDDEKNYFQFYPP